MREGCRGLYSSLFAVEIAVEDYFSGVFHTVAKQVDNPYVFLVFLGSLVAQMKVWTCPGRKGPLFWSV